MSAPSSPQGSGSVQAHRLASPSLGEIILRVLAAAGLAYDAYSHWVLAPVYDNPATINQSTLFRIESVLAVLAAVGVLFIRRKIVTVFALLVAAGGLAALLLYRYVDIGAFGPFPNMYEPVWTTPAVGNEKIYSAISMAVATVACIGLLMIKIPRRRH